MQKRVLTIIGIGILGISYYSYKKYKAAKAIIEKLSVRPKDIKDVKLSLKKISFKVDLELLNNTHFDLGFTTGSIIRLTAIKVYTPSTMLLANFQTNISSVEIPAYGSYIIPNLQIEIPTHNLITQLDNITQYVNTNALQYELTLSAFGKQFTITT